MKFPPQTIILPRLPQSGDPSHFVALADALQCDLQARGEADGIVIPREDQLLTHFHDRFATVLAAKGMALGGNIEARSHLFRELGYRVGDFPLENVARQMWERLLSLGVVRDEETEVTHVNISPVLNREDSRNWLDLQWINAGIADFLHPLDFMGGGISGSIDTGLRHHRVEEVYRAVIQRLEIFAHLLGLKEIRLQNTRSRQLLRTEEAERSSSEQ